MLMENYQRINWRVNYFLFYRTCCFLTVKFCNGKFHGKFHGKFVRNEKLSAVNVTVTVTATATLEYSYGKFHGKFVNVNSLIRNCQMSIY